MTDLSIPMSAEEIQAYDKQRRQLYRQLVVLGDIIESHGGPKPSPLTWIPTRKFVPQDVNLELANLDDTAPHD